MNINLARRYHWIRLEETNTMVPALISNFTVCEPWFQKGERLKTTTSASSTNDFKPRKFFESDLVFWFHCELMFWTIGSGYILSSDRSNVPGFSIYFDFLFYYKTWFCVILMKSMICTARQVHWICLLTCFDIIRWSTLFLIFIFFYYLIKLQKLITLSFLIQKIPFFLLKSSFIFLFLMINFP